MRKQQNSLGNKPHSMHAHALQDAQIRASLNITMHTETTPNPLFPLCTSTRTSPMHCCVGYQLQSLMQLWTLYSYAGSLYSSSKQLCNGRTLYTVFHSYALIYYVPGTKLFTDVSMATAVAPQGVFWKFINLLDCSSSDRCASHCHCQTRWGQHHMACMFQTSRPLRT